MVETQRHEHTCEAMKICISIYTVYLYIYLHYYIMFAFTLTIAYQQNKARQVPQGPSDDGFVGVAPRGNGVHDPAHEGCKYGALPRVLKPDMDP